MTGKCKNCAEWSSTDQVWGKCTRIAADYDREHNKRAAIDLEVYGDPDPVYVALRTNADFGCTEWSSLKQSLARVTR
jgi:hypothetical protein